MTDQLPSLTSDENNVRITIPKQRMKEFIGDVLKTKRQIGREFESVFHVKKDDILGIISVINHRVKEQNIADLAEISIYVLYDDGSSREYTSVAQFESLDDNLKAVSTTVLVTMSYLIKFSNDEFPNKNDIKILMRSSEALIKHQSQVGNIVITVESNKFTWSEDIMNNFSSYIEGRFEKHSRLHRTAQSVVSAVRSSFYVYIAMMLFCSWAFFSYLADISYLNIQRITPLIDSLSGFDIESANDKLDFLISLRSTNSYANIWNMEVGYKYILYIVTAIFIITILPSNYVRLTEKSYISLGRVSEEKNSSTIKNRRMRIHTILIGCVLSIVCSLFSSYLYDFFKSVPQP